MRLTDADIDRFRDEGYLFLPGLFRPDEAAPLRRETDRIAALHREEVLRDDAGELRAAPAMNCAAFLDEAIEFNGPLMPIPGSHGAGLLDDRDSPLPGGKSPLRTLPRAAVAALAAGRGIAAPKGSAGSVIFFSGGLAHASAPNPGPWTRYVVDVACNPAGNAIPRPTRPAYYAERSDFAPLRPLSDDCLDRAAA